MDKNNQDKNVVNDKELRIKAISNYKFYIEHLYNDELKAESKRIEKEAMDTYITLHEPDFDDNGDNDIVMHYN